MNVRHLTSAAAERVDGQRKPLTHKANLVREGSPVERDAVLRCQMGRGGHRFPQGRLGTQHRSLIKSCFQPSLSRDCFLGTARCAMAQDVHCYRGALHVGADRDVAVVTQTAVRDWEIVSK